jgi:hypothetical protein
MQGGDKTSLTSKAGVAPQDEDRGEMPGRREAKPTERVCSYLSASVDAALPVLRPGKRYWLCFVCISRCETILPPERRKVPTDIGPEAFIPNSREFWSVPKSMVISSHIVIPPSVVHSTQQVQVASPLSQQSLTGGRQAAFAVVATPNMVISANAQE